MIGLVQVGVQSMADRYAYIPLLGIFVIVCWGGADLLRTLRVPLKVSGLVAAVVLLALGFALHRQVSFWSDNLTLWTHTLEITGANYTAEDNLATALIASGRSCPTSSTSPVFAARRPHGHTQPCNLRTDARPL
jgi:hypothetical protein